MKGTDVIGLITEARWHWRAIAARIGEADEAIGGHGRSVVADGNLVSAFGDLIAAAVFGVTLTSSVGPSADGVLDDRPDQVVEIKSTAKTEWHFRRPKSDAVPDWIVCLKIEGDRFVPERYGPSKPLYDVIHQRLASPKEWSASVQKSIAASKLPQTSDRTALRPISQEALEAARQPLRD